MFHLSRYLNDTDFQIIYWNGKINMINYEKINYMEDHKISLASKTQNIVVSGENLRVTKLLENEILIVGEFLAIEFHS